MLNNDECIYFNQTVLSEPIYVECSRRYLWDRLKRFTIVSVLAITVLVGSSISFIIDSFDRVNQMWLFIFLLLYSIFIGYTINQYILSFHRQYSKNEKEQYHQHLRYLFFWSNYQDKNERQSIFIEIFSNFKDNPFERFIYVIYGQHVFRAGLFCDRSNRFF